MFENIGYLQEDLSFLGDSEVVPMLMGERDGDYIGGRICEGYASHLPVEDIYLDVIVDSVTQETILAAGFKEL